MASLYSPRGFHVSDSSLFCSSACYEICNQYSDDSCDRAIVRSHGQSTNKESVMGKRPSISELEAILQREAEVEIEILPSGEVRAKNDTTAAERGGRKPL